MGYYVGFSVALAADHGISDSILVATSKKGALCGLYCCSAIDIDGHEKWHRRRALRSHATVGWYLTKVLRSHATVAWCRRKVLRIHATVEGGT